MLIKSWKSSNSTNWFARLAWFADLIQDSDVIFDFLDVVFSFVIECVQMGLGAVVLFLHQLHVLLNCNIDCVLVVFYCSQLDSQRVNVLN